MPVIAPAVPRARWSSLRLRHSAHLRDLCGETSFTTAHLVQPLFVVEGLSNLPPSAYEVGFVSLAHDDAILEEAAAALIEAAAEVARS